MREIAVYAGDVARRRPSTGPAPSGAEPLLLDVDAPDGDPSRVNLRLAHITRRMVTDLPDRLVDLRELACYVYCADQFARRDSVLMPRMGEDWRRDFAFHAAVRDLKFWKRGDVKQALASTLGFLSDDRYRFSFERSRRRTPLQRHLDLEEDESSARFDPDRVVLFSGGLDSFAGAADALLAGGERIALVSHYASPMLGAKQAGLVRALRELAPPGRLMRISVRVDTGGEDATEFTQRSRSFLFAALGFVVARLFEKDEVTFCENGVVSLNLPIAPHVVGSRATRTTHPRVLKDLGRLFSLAAERPVRVANPLFWMTKADVVRRIAELGCAGLIPQTFSCAAVRRATRTGRHCGVCSQCVDRRFAVLAAGWGGAEPEDLYEVELLAGAREPGPALTLAGSYVLAASRFAAMSEPAFLANSGQVFRALPFLDLPQPEAAERLHALHVRHGRSVLEVLRRHQTAHDPVAARLALADASLLSMIQAPATAASIDFVDRAEAGPAASDQAAQVGSRTLPRPLRFAVDRAAKRVVLAGGVALGQGDFKLVEALLEAYTQDRDANRPAADCRFVRADRLARRMGVDDETLRARVSRTRKSLKRESLKREFLARFGVEPDEHEVIETGNGRGYRLNPHLALVSLGVLAAEEAPPKGDVTAFRADVTTAGG